MRQKYLFVLVEGPQRRVEIFHNNELHYSWPLVGGYLVSFTEYFLRRLLCADGLALLYKDHIVDAELDPKQLRFPAPRVYNRVRPPLWARIKNFFNNLRK